MSPKVAIDRTIVAHDQPDAESAIQSVAPREPKVDAAQARGSVGAKGNSAGALNLRGGMHAGARGQGADARPAAPAKPVTNPSWGHEEVHRSVRLHRPVEPATSGRGSVRLRRAEVRKELTKETRKLVLKVRRCPPPPTTRNKVVLRAKPSPPPSTRRRLALRARPSPPSPPTGKKVILRATRCRRQPDRNSPCGQGQCAAQRLRQPGTAFPAQSVSKDGR